MQIAEFRDAVEQLGRYASVREGAPSPTDRIFVRSSGDVLTLVAGDSDRTMRVTASSEGCDQGKALVSARLLLTAGKALRGKGDVSFSFDGRGGATMLTSGGGRIVLSGVGSELPDWTRPTTLSPDLTASIPAGFWPTLAKFIEVEGDILSGESDIAMRVEGDRLRLTWAHRYVWLTTLLDAPDPLFRGDVGGLSLDFVRSLRGIDQPSSLLLHLGPVHVVSGAYTAVCRQPPYITTTYDLNEPDVTHRVVCDRKALVGALKALSNSDEHKRVTLSVGAGTLTVAEYNGLSSVDVPARVDGRGQARVALVQPRLMKLLAALQGDEVTIGLDSDNDAPVSLTEGHEWRVYLAPVRR